VSARASLGSGEHRVQLVFAWVILSDCWLCGLLRVSARVLLSDGRCDGLQSLCTGPIRFNLGLESVCPLSHRHLLEHAGSLDLLTMPPRNNRSDWVHHVLCD
jgi:hypothetical protein